jgi:hypothetical protein
VHQLSADQEAALERVLRRREMRDRMRVRRSALGGRIDLYQSLLDGLELVPERRRDALRVRFLQGTVADLTERGGVGVAERFFADAYDHALVDLQLDQP